MAQNKKITIGPIAISNAAGNLINPPTTVGGVNCGTPAPYVLIRHIRIVNKTAGAVTCSFWLGASGGSAAGTEVIGTGLSIAANSFHDYYGELCIDTAQFLTGLASALTSLVMTAEAEIGLR